MTSPVNGIRPDVPAADDMDHRGRLITEAMEWIRTFTHANVGVVKRLIRIGVEVGALIEERDNAIAIGLQMIEVIQASYTEAGQVWTRLLNVEMERDEARGVALRSSEYLEQWAHPDKPQSAEVWLADTIADEREGCERQRPDLDWPKGEA